ncbi:glucose transporter [Trichosporon asahii var. asahii CBS 8904]|uniref:Glucose transporter n=1 Tax=Trichosporon asahii var. asahii (strain CBS 8904) TaxID=1220162 RepID=K1VMY6_TRIAC|nr:glucose transporter [Trichosporon asahii var. asahii CBS 8904]
MPLSPKAYTLLCGCFAALGSILFGYLTGQDSSTQNYIGFITSSLLLGAFVGCIPASLIADMFSRRVAITVGAVTFLLGGALQTGATNKEFMMAGRFFAGMSIGQLALLVPLYQSEIAHPSIRGRLTTLQQFFLGIGALTAAWINYGMIHNYLGTALQWRFPLGFQMAPAVPLLFVTLILPESPRWLMLKGREDEALLTLAKLHARGDTSDPFVLGEFHEMQAKIREEAQIDQGWGQIFHNPQNFRRVMLGVILQFSVQMTGVSFLQYYAPRIFAKVGFSTETTLLLGAAGGFPNMASQFAVVMLVDKLGRRRPLIVCNAISGFLYIFILWITYKFTVDDSGTATMGRAFVALTWIWNIFFSWIGSLSWAYPVEIMNSAIRAKAVALTSMACWIANFMICGWKYYILFVVCGFTNAFTMWALFPETKGRTLEEMDDYFASTNWFVPLAKTKDLDSRARERELAEKENENQFPEKEDGKASVEHLEV